MSLRSRIRLIGGHYRIARRYAPRLAALRIALALSGC